MWKSFLLISFFLINVYIEIFVANKKLQPTVTSSNCDYKKLIHTKIFTNYIFHIKSILFYEKYRVLQYDFLILKFLLRRQIVAVNSRYIWETALVAVITFQWQSCTWPGCLCKFQKKFFHCIYVVTYNGQLAYLPPAVIISFIHF